MPGVTLFSAATLGAVLLQLAAPAAAASTITTFDPPGSRFTQTTGINDQGVIVGSMDDANGVTHGFLRAADGTFTKFDPPGSTGTLPAAINADGAIVGSFSDSNGTHCFVRAPGGTYAVFTPQPHVYNTALWINGKGQTAGTVSLSRDQSYAFVGNTRNRTKDITKMFGTGAAISINDTGEVAGDYGDNAGIHGFVRGRNGMFTSFDALPGGRNTYVTGMNAASVVTGYYLNSNSNQIGFVRAANGVLTSFSPPDGDGLQALAINNSGTTTGYFVGQGFEGFVRTSDGTFTPFSVPGGTAVFSQSINASGATAGYFLDSNEIGHGFVRSP